MSQTINYSNDPAISYLQENQVRQTKIGDCGYSATPVLAHNLLTISSYEDGTILITGNSNGSIAWSARLEIAPVSRCEVWMTDPASEISPTIFIVTWGINSSGGWDTKLSVLLFDKQGKPMPWQVMSHFTTNNIGVQEVVRPPGSEVRSILVPTREKTDNGFTYIYDLYDIVGDRIQSVTSNRYGLKWPSIPKNKPDIKAHHVINALSTTEASATAERDHLPSRMTALARRPDDDNLQIQLENGAVARMPQILVEDTAKGERRIIFEPTETDLRRLVKSDAKVQLIGRSCDWENCTPLILRASKP